MVPPIIITEDPRDLMSRGLDHVGVYFKGNRKLVNFGTSDGSEKKSFLVAENTKTSNLKSEIGLLETF